MKSDFIEEVYWSMLGTTSTPVFGVESAFKQGSPCDRCYREVYAAYDRLCNRLNTDSEDIDLLAQ